MPYHPPRPTIDFACECRMRVDRGAPTMNTIMTGYYPVFEEYQAMRAQLMQTLSDSDRARTPGGANPSLGALCREIGEVQRAYIDSFKTFTLDFSYRNTAPGLAGSVTQL